MGRRKGMGGAVAEVVAYTPKLTQEEKDQQIITCCKCGVSKVAKGNYYFIKTQKWDKRMGRYYRTEFYKRMCIPCSNAYDRKWSKDHPKEHAANTRRSWRQLHAKKPSTRALVYPEAYRDQPKPK